jgi:hypothetical protein
MITAFKYLNYRLAISDWFRKSFSIKLNFCLFDKNRQQTFRQIIESAIFFGILQHD